MNYCMMPWQVLGDGELPFPLTIKAEQFSTSARKKIEAAGMLDFLAARHYPALNSAGLICSIETDELQMQYLR